MCLYPPVRHRCRIRRSIRFSYSKRVITEIFCDNTIGYYQHGVVAEGKIYRNRRVEWVMSEKLFFFFCCRSVFSDLWPYNSITYKTYTQSKNRFWALITLFTLQSCKLFFQFVFTHFTIENTLGGRRALQLAHRTGLRWSSIVLLSKAVSKREYWHQKWKRRPFGHSCRYATCTRGFRSKTSATFVVACRTTNRQ